MLYSLLMHNYTSKLINATKWKRYSPLLKASEECSVGSIRIIHAGGALLPFLSWRITSGGPFTYHSKVWKYCMLSLHFKQCTSKMRRPRFLMNFYCGNNFKYKERTNIFGYDPVNYHPEWILNFQPINFK